jgi:FdhE protein
MAPVTVGAATRDAVLAQAASRWEELLRSRPDLQAPIALQTRLIQVIVDLADAFDRGRLPRLSLPPRYLAAKLERGIPALSGEPIPVPAVLLRPALLRLCAELEGGGAGEAAANIRAAIEQERLDAGSLLTASLGRSRAAIQSGALHHGLSPDLLWLVAELATSPFAHALQQAVVVPACGHSGAAWSHGYCPACGSWPALAEVVARRRVLRCSFCAFAWDLEPCACVYCRNETGTFVTAAPHQDRMDRRLEICGACGGYLKALDVNALSPFPLLAIADLETMDLDAAAIEKGYTRPQLKDFGR